jgi:hypothetical protein
MKNKLLVSLCVAAAFAVAIALAQEKKEEATKPASRIDKLLEQNEQKLKNEQDALKSQEAILQRLDKVDQELLGVRRRAGTKNRLKK